MSAADCTACGCCCFSDAPDYIAVFGVDEARMDATARGYTVVRQGRRFMRFAGGRCSALRLEGGRFLCAIYAMRPDACRWLAPESGACREQIRDNSERAAHLTTQQSPIVTLRLRA